MSIAARFVVVLAAAAGCELSDANGAVTMRPMDNPANVPVMDRRNQREPLANMLKTQQMLQHTASGFALNWVSKIVN